MLGQFNAGGTAPIQYQSLKKYYYHTRYINSYEQYPVFAWIIENLNRQYASTDSASSFIRPCFDNIIMSIKYMINLLNKDNLIVRKKDLGQSTNDSTNIVVKANERKKAIDYIIEFVSIDCPDKIIICDKYFDPSCLDIIYEITKYNKDIMYYVLTSNSHQNNILKGNSPKEEYNDHWRRNISGDPFPNIELLIVTADKNFPFHDRYLVCGDRVLNIGTSLNSLGISSVSQISVNKDTAASTIVEEINQYLNRNRRVADREVEYSLYAI